MSFISRRVFLKTSAALVTASAAGKAVAGANERIPAAVIGVRNRGKQVANAFQGSGRFDMVSICDCDRSMMDKAMVDLQKKLPTKPRLVQDFRRVLDDKNIGAIINATPDHWHALITTMALEAGKHVYLEKPASYNINDGRAMVVAQKKHPKLTVLVGTQQRSGQHFKDARQFVTEGGLGKVAFSRAWITHTRPVIPIIPDSDPPTSLDYEMWLGPAPYRPYNKNRVHYNWHFMKDYGTGEMGNWGTHWLDIIRYMMNLDLPESVSGTGGKFVFRDAKEWPDTQTLTFEYPDLTLLWEERLWTNFRIHDMACGAELGGEKGSLVIDREGWTFYPKKGEPVKHPGSPLTEPHVKNFANCIAGSAKPVSSIEEGHKSAILCHLGNIAVALNRRLEFDSVTQTIKNIPEANSYFGREYRKPWKLPS
ncbi:MAG: Gfo/Idh/MocA family oxidoreductase [Planctomycetota bacterium]|nr:MAG: Gfo/Idh/MocA family oxidoreductase [Planctomycetota bacterium]